jgi:hypothetical protein
MLESGKASKEDFMPVYMDFIKGMIENGPLSSHIEYISMLKGDSAVEFKSSFQVHVPYIFTIP